MAVLSSDAHSRPTGSSSWSTPLASPRTEQEFFRARHRNVEQPALFAHVGNGHRHDAVVDASDDRRSNRQALRVDHRHDPHAATFREGAILPERRDLRQEPAESLAFFDQLIERVQQLDARRARGWDHLAARGRDHPMPPPLLGRLIGCGVRGQPCGHRLHHGPHPGRGARGVGKIRYIGRKQRFAELDVRAAGARS